MRRKALSPLSVLEFQETIYGHYRENRRVLPWRKTRNPYRILVSEVMLQQTQVGRVREKYRQFVKAFPDFASLAKAPLREVLGLWQGMGYNRRAAALKKAACAIVAEFGGKLPSSPEELVKLPGIGRYSASAIAAFAFNMPTVFVETNIRRVFLHFFFRDREKVGDPEILPLVEKTLDRSDPREWYYALMDYGAMLRKEGVNPNRKSAHYKKQSPFRGSDRQIRGMILKLLVERPGLSGAEVTKELTLAPQRAKRGLAALKAEGLISRKDRIFFVG